MMGGYSVRGSQGNIQKSTIVQGNTGDNGSFEDDIEKAIRLSLQEGGGHPPPPATITKVQEDDYDEEAALAAAITASLQDNDYHTASTRSSQQGQSQPSYDTPSSSATFGSTAAANSEYSSLMVISPIERENVQLFAQLICRLDRDDETLNDPQFLQLAKDMINLRDRLRVAQEKSNSSSFFDLPRIIASLDDAILRFEQLTQPLPYLEQQLHRPKSPAGSITKVDTSRPSAPLPQPPPADVVPVLRPMPLRKSEENLLIPDLDDDAHHQPQQTPKSQPNEDPLAELIVDTPLIQL